MRELLEGYFDFHYRHRRDLVLLLTELSTLIDLDLIDTVLVMTVNPGFGGQRFLESAPSRIAAVRRLIVVSSTWFGGTTRGPGPFSIPGFVS